MHVGFPDWNEPSFIEVFGALVPKFRKDQVRILSFNRFDDFRKALLESNELRACREALERSGFNSDLDAYELGSGKLFVDPEIAWPTLTALQHRAFAGRTTKSSDVVVNGPWAAKVEEAVNVYSRRSLWVKHVEVLDALPLSTVGTFITVGEAASCAESARTQSTTDLAVDAGLNPRACVPQPSQQA